MTDIRTDSNTDPDAAPASANGNVGLQEVRHVAALASLHLTAEEETGMQRDLNAILMHVAALDGVDTTGVPAMAQVGQLLEIAVPPGGTGLRADTERPSVERRLVMQEAPETDGRFFKVPKVIER